MVRLKDLTDLMVQRYQECFNSTMVRLKGRPHRILRKLRKSFNSTMVRLKDRKINGDIIEKPRYFYKQKITSTFKSRQRPVVRNSREVDDMAWLCLKLR